MRIKSTWRYELKYLIQREQYAALVDELSAQMTSDAHGDENGRYPITSLYYDTPDYKAYWDKLEGHRNRRKVRVRIYGNQDVAPETPVYLEIKHRINTRMSKRRAVLPYDVATAFAAFAELVANLDVDDTDNELSLAPDEEAVLREVAYLYRTLQLRPACVVRYDRMAFMGNENYPDLRITLDTNLRCRTHDLSLLSMGHADDHFFLPPEYAILEVKSNHNVPFWVTQLLTRHRCTFNRFSKYCRALEHDKIITSRQRIVQFPA